MPTLRDAVSDFAERRAIAPPAVDQTTGAYALAVGDRHIIHLRELDGEVAIWAWLGDLPTDAGACEATVRRLLRAELARFGDDDVVLSVDEAARELHLHRRVARAEFEGATLESLLQSLVDSVERRRRFLGDRPRPQPVAPMIIRP
jgi:hypothetical protein